MLSSRVFRSAPRSASLAAISSCSYGSPSTSGSASGKGKLAFRQPSISSSSPSRTSPSCSRAFSSSIARAAQEKEGTVFYVATLPWAEEGTDRKERFNSLIKNARFTENDKIVASSITTSKRASPIASSLKAEIEHINSTNQQGGGAWLLLRAKDEEEARSILDEVNASEVFDLESTTLQSVQLDQKTTEGEGPLYADSSNDPSSSTSATASDSAMSSDANGDSRVVEEVPGSSSGSGSGDNHSSTSRRTGRSSSGKKSGQTDKTDRNASENAAVAEESRIGGHSVETSGPLYGK